MEIPGWAAQEAGGVLRRHQFAYERSLAPEEVEIEVTHCGLCHSDLHLIDNAWGTSKYPLIPGHEVIGHVVRCGASVRRLEPGQRVGVGWQCGACLECDQCTAGYENLCRRAQNTCVGRPGGFAGVLRVDARFAFRIPDGLSSVGAAPLLCGGATVYAPLRRFGVSAQHRVGVVGVGGLGHLALQFARARGCEVTALSRSPDKSTEACLLGADAFVDTSQPGALRSCSSRFDLLLTTSHASLDWAGLVRTLRPGGTLCLLGIPSEPLSLPAGLLAMRQRSVTGSLVAGRSVIREMLDVAARHGIAAKTEVYAIEDAARGVARLRANAARYRVVFTLSGRE